MENLMQEHEVILIKTELRKFAISLAERVGQPNAMNNAQLGNPYKERSIKSLLDNANQIYEWLIKEL